MRAVVISNNPPPGSGPENGGQQRFARFARAVVEAGATSVRLLQYTPAHEDPGADWIAAQEARLAAAWGVAVGVRRLPYARVPKTHWAEYGAGLLDGAAMPLYAQFAHPEAVRIVAEEAAAADLLHASLLSSMVPVLRAGRAARPRLVTFDLCDLEHVLHRRLASAEPGAARRLLRLAQTPALVRFELRAAAAADLAFLCSPLEVAAFRRLGARAAIEVVPNVSAAPPVPPGVVAAPALLFLGALDYPPNRDAAERMAARIFPLIRHAVPEARLVVAGRRPDCVPSAAAPPPGVTFAGFVPDLDAAYAAARIVVAPIDSGSGTRNKLVEAAAHARPMVSTALGAEGLEFRDGRDILLRESDAEFAAACVRLLRDDAECLRLGTAARETMLAQYEEAAAQARLVTALRALRGAAAP